MNPDLLCEREATSFNTEILTNLLDGGNFMTDQRRHIEKLILNDNEFEKKNNFHFLSRPEQYEECIRKLGLYFKLIKKYSIENRADSYFLSNIIFPNEITPYGLHETAFIPYIESQGTDEQKQKWLPLAKSRAIIGTYVQTEMGHGSNIRQLETTATYDSATQQFILHSPTLTSTKWWPGGLGKTCSHAVVMARLVIENVDHGIHPFVIQLRDIQTHQPLHGITVGDIGPKLGFPMVDNGFLRFNQYRIPRENLLMKNFQVTPEGKYIRSGDAKLTYGSMVFLRAMVVMDQAARGLAQAVTIAIRYSCVRRQSEIVPGAGEVKVLDYQMQQYKLFVQLANAYAYTFAGLKIRETYFAINYEIQQGNLDGLPELHATSAGLKALATDGAMFGVEQCRLACGGHGYSMASGISKIYGNVTAACTYEGENTVLYLQTARYLVKASQQKDDENLSPNIQYLKKNIPKLSFPLSNLMIIDAFMNRAKCLVESVSNRLTDSIKSGMDKHTAWNSLSYYLVIAAKAHCDLYVISQFSDKINEVDDMKAKNALNNLFQLYAINIIVSKPSHFIYNDVLSLRDIDRLEDQMMSLLSSIRSDAVGLVDAFDFSDHLLGSVLGRYDGQVYQSLYEWAQQSPLNQTQVHDSIWHLKQKPVSKL